MVTELAKELKKKGFKVAGFTSPEHKKSGRRDSFYVQDVETGKKALLASVDSPAPRVSKYGVDVKSFESVAVPALQKAKSNGCDVVIIDEIGPMEMYSSKFGDLLFDLFEMDIPVIASLHRNFVNDYNVYGDVYYIEADNRGRVFSRLHRDVLNLFKKVKPKKLLEKPSPKPKKRARPKKRVKPKAKKKRAKPKSMGCLKEKNMMIIESFLKVIYLRMWNCLRNTIH